MSQLATTREEGTHPDTAPWTTLAPGWAHRLRNAKDTTKELSVMCKGGKKKPLRRKATAIRRVLPHG